MDSINDVIDLCETDKGGRLVFVPGDPDTIRFYDERGRCLDVISAHRFAGLRAALDIALPTSRPLDDFLAYVANECAEGRG